MDEEEYDLILQFQKEDEKEDDAERVKRLATASKYRVKRRATSTDEDDEDVDYMPRTRDRLPLSQRNDYTEALEDLEDFEESIQARYAARSRKKKCMMRRPQILRMMRRTQILSSKHFHQPSFLILRN